MADFASHQVAAANLLAAFKPLQQTYADISVSAAGFQQGQSSLQLQLTTLQPYMQMQQALMGQYASQTDIAATSSYNFATLTAQSLALSQPFFERFKACIASLNTELAIFNALYTRTQELLSNLAPIEGLLAKVGGLKEGRGGMHKQVCHNLDLCKQVCKNMYRKVLTFMSAFRIFILPAGDTLRT